MARPRKNPAPETLNTEVKTVSEPEQEPAKKKATVKVAAMENVQKSSQMAFEKRTYRITGLTPILGSQPASEAVRTAYIGSKAPDAAKTEEEAEMVPDIEEQGLTVFMRAPQTDAICLLDYMIRGFFKASLQALEAQNKVLQARSKVDRYLFITPRVIPITRNGELIYDEDDQNERPLLRAETARGSRTALAASEQINDPWQIEFSVILLPNKASNSSAKVTFDDVEQALEYGALSGLGQWRNGGYGRFIWERIPDDVPAAS